MATTSHHPAELASWFYRGAMAVADGELCVGRVGGFRVADASVMPKVPGGHTEIPVKVLNVIERLQLAP